MENKHFLETIFPPADFTQAELAGILPKFKQVAFAKNAFLLREGEKARDYWFLEKGYARSFVVDRSGNDITTSFYGTGDIVIDWSSFFLRTPTRENIQALTDCIGWQLDFDTFQQLFHSIKPFREQGRSRLVGAYFALKNHNVSFIADDAKERYMQLLKEKPYLIQHVPLQHIATFLGITRYSLSRIRKAISL